MTAPRISLAEMRESVVASRTRGYLQPDFADRVLALVEAVEAAQAHIRKCPVYAEPHYLALAAALAPFVAEP